MYHKDGESGGSLLEDPGGSLEAGVGITRVLWNYRTMLPVTPHHLLQRSLEPHGTRASCLVHGDSRQLRQAAWLIPSTDGGCLLSNHELSPSLVIFFHMSKTKASTSPACRGMLRTTTSNAQVAFSLPATPVPVKRRQLELQCP